MSEERQCDDYILYNFIQLFTNSDLDLSKLRRLLFERQLISYGW